MRIPFAYIVLFCMSCQTIHKKNFKKTHENVQKIDASSLSVELKAEDYKQNAYSGILLSPELDSNADYILYEICSLEKSKNTCTHGKINGLMPEVIYDAPHGEIKIEYQACVKEIEDFAHACGSKKSVIMKHEVENSAPLYLN